jgi:hypothetical protein
LFERIFAFFRGMKQRFLNDFRLETAINAGKNDDIEQWVHTYLCSQGNNKPFSDGLYKAERFWRGPLLVPMSLLERTCGPEPHLPYRVSLEHWQLRISEYAGTFHTLSDFPPLIVNWHQNKWLISDGNHRYGAFSQLGLKTCWIIIWYANLTDYHCHEQMGLALT